MPDQQQSQHQHAQRPEPHIDDPMQGMVPTRVAVALNFIAMCNQRMGLHGYINPQHIYIEELELHPAQEGAFRLACQAVGNYFREPGRPAPMEFAEPTDEVKV